MTLLVESEKDLEYLVQRVKEESEHIGLYLNMKTNNNKKNPDGNDNSRQQCSSLNNKL